MNSILGRKPLLHARILHIFLLAFLLLRHYDGREHPDCQSSAEGPVILPEWFFRRRVPAIPDVL